MRITTPVATRGTGAADAAADDAFLSELEVALDRPQETKPVDPPAPKPPVAARPAGLSVTDIENWLRDPYTIYAKHVLRLFPCCDKEGIVGLDNHKILHPDHSHKLVQRMNVVSR